MKTKQLIAFTILLIGLSACNNNHSNSITDGSYQEKVQTGEEMERAEPTTFLSADGTYNSNFWGDKLKVHGKITNKATVATYKDAVVTVTYYSKTKTVLASNNYTIYDFFPPHSEKNFELKIDTYKDVETIGWDVISATPN